MVWEVLNIGKKILLESIQLSFVKGEERFYEEKDNGVALIRNYDASASCFVTVHTPLSREVFWHKYAKIPRHTARLYAISIKSVHRVACYWARSEQ